MEDYADIHNYFLATPDSFRKLQYVPETVKDEDKAPKKDEVSITGEDAFIAQAPLWPVGDFRSTRFLGSQGHVEDTCSEGGVVAEMCCCRSRTVSPSLGRPE